MTVDEPNHFRFQLAEIANLQGSHNKVDVCIFIMRFTFSILNISKMELSKHGTFTFELDGSHLVDC